MSLDTLAKPQQSVSIDLPIDLARDYFDLTAPDGDLPDPALHAILDEALPPKDGLLVEIRLGGSVIPAVRVRGAWHALSTLEVVASDGELDQRGAGFRPLRLVDASTS